MLLIVLLTLSVLGLALLLGAAAYESVVMAPNYEREIPASIEAARAFLKRRTPAHYFRVLSPAAQLLLLASAIAGWDLPLARWRALLALAVLVVVDIITFAFHYPRLRVMFKASPPANAEQLRKAAHEWALGNIVRAILLVVATLLVLQAFAEAMAWAV